MSGRVTLPDPDEARGWAMAALMGGTLVMALTWRWRLSLLFADLIGLPLVGNARLGSFRPAYSWRWSPVRFSTAGAWTTASARLCRRRAPRRGEPGHRDYQSRKGG